MIRNNNNIKRINYKINQLIYMNNKNINNKKQRERNKEMKINMMKMNMMNKIKNRIIKYKIDIVNMMNTHIK